MSLRWQGAGAFTRRGSVSNDGAYKPKSGRRLFLREVAIDPAQRGEPPAHLALEEGQHLLDRAEEKLEFGRIPHIRRMARLQAGAVIGEAEQAVAAADHGRDQ